MSVPELREERPATMASADAIGRSIRPTVTRPRIWETAWLPPLLAFIAFVGAWYFASLVLLDRDKRFMLPPPHQVIQVGMLDRENFLEILFGLWSTTQVALVGLSISIVLGIVLATLMSQGLFLERSLFPYAQVIQTIPILALVPLIGFWFQFNFTSRVIVCVLISLFPIVTSTLFGLKSVDSGLHDLFTLHGASRLTRLRKLQFPAALPTIFTGLRIAAGASVIGAIVGDFFFRQGQAGIGRLLDVYRANLQAEQLFTSIFLSSLLGLSVFWMFGWLAERVVGAWHESGRRQS
jgi:NitT/TauT family transport system permease protein